MYSALHILRNTLYTAQCTSHTAYNIIYITLHTVHCMLHEKDREIKIETLVSSCKRGRPMAAQLQQG